MTRKHCPVPPGWPEYRIEIDKLLRTAQPDYEQRVYITPIFYIEGIRDNPELYPRLARHTESLQKRYISTFLKEQGRVSRSKTNLNAKVWMIPGAA